MTSGNHLRPGRRLCAPTSDLAALLGREIVQARARLPDELRPAALAVHFEPAVASPEPGAPLAQVHLETGALLLTRELLDGSNRGVLLHELVHVGLRGPRPREAVASRTLLAIEEGVADYVAASAQGSPILGAGLGRLARNLESSLGIAPDWEALAVGRRFDPHPLGASLAGHLWARRSELDATALVGCFRLPSDVTSVTGVVATTRLWLRSCPAGVRPVVARAIRSWLPAELRRDGPAESSAR